MSTVVPAAPTPTPIQSAALAALQVMAAENAEELAKLAAGSQLTVQIKEAPAKGLLEVAGDNGLLTLKLPANLKLPADGQLTLQVLKPPGGGLAFKLLAVNGAPLLPGGLPGVLPGGLPLLPDPGQAFPAAGPLPGGAAPSAFGSTQPAVVPGGVVAPGVPSPAAAPLGVNATVLRPAGGQPGQDLPPGMPPAPPGLAGLAAGSTLTLRIAAVLPPGTDPAVAFADLAAAAPMTPAAAAPAPGTAAPPPGTPQPAVAPAGSPLPASPAPAPAPAATPPLSLAPQPPKLAGQVVSHPAGGNPVVQTPAGLLSLHADVALPQGAPVVFEVAAPPQPPPAAAAAPAAAPLSSAAAGWPALDEAAATLTNSDRAAADQMMKAMPQLGPRLAVGLAAFAGALRSGELRQAIGDGGIRGLERAGRRDLLDRLRKEFKDLADETARPLGQAGEWRAYAMPLFTGAEIDPIRLYVRRPPEEVGEDGAQGGGKRGQEQRFILEVGMTRLGRIQMDGLVIRENKRFDLIVRSYEPLSETMRRDIAGIFAECSQLTGTAGQVVFQAGRFVELPPTDAGGTAITV